MKHTVKRCPICGAPNIYNDGSMNVEEICEFCEKEVFKDEKPEIKEQSKIHRIIIDCITTIVITAITLFVLIRASKIVPYDLCTFLIVYSLVLLCSIIISVFINTKKIINAYGKE